MDKIISNFKNIVLNKYLQFDGKADRSEYWLYVLATFAIGVVLNLLLGAFARVRILYWIIYALQILVCLFLLLPGLAVTVRRLRDAGKSWGWIFICLIPIAGAIWLIVLLAKPSQQTDEDTPAQQ